MTLSNKPRLTLKLKTAPSATTNTAAAPAAATAAQQKKDQKQRTTDLRTNAPTWTQHQKNKHTAWSLRRMWLAMMDCAYVLETQTEHDQWVHHFQTAFPAIWESVRAHPVLSPKWKLKPCPAPPVRKFTEDQGAGRADTEKSLTGPLIASLAEKDPGGEI